jgi:deazaflavin-dependent oxidoreductase (nitroreductase family)
VAVTGRLLDMSENEVRIAKNRDVIEQYRANAGAVPGYEGTPLLLLTTTGAKTGEPRISPVVYLEDGDDLVVFGANGGRGHHPGWVHNLATDPHATVEVADRTLPVTAHVAEGAERRRLWDRAVGELAHFGEFQAGTDRLIPVVVLTRT